MYSEQSTTPMSSHAAALGIRPGPPALLAEDRWRQLRLADDAPGIVASRWTDERVGTRHCSDAGRRYVLAVALRPTRLRLVHGRETLFEGTMPMGMVHVTEPGQALEATFLAPCDFIHFHVASSTLAERQAAAEPPRSLRNLLVRDDLVAQLARTLTEERNGGDPCYVASVGQTVLMRVLTHRMAAPRAGSLPKWRLKRVQEHLAANLSESVRLADLAQAAGLSRMHFAAQFRAATGCRPHDYLLQQRIEHAKQMLTSTDTPLVQVALSVGFQTQSHFSTVFKRLAGETPARWQRARRAA